MSDSTATARARCMDGRSCSTAGSGPRASLNRKRRSLTAVQGRPGGRLGGTAPTGQELVEQSVILVELIAVQRSELLAEPSRECHHLVPVVIDRLPDAELGRLALDVLARTRCPPRRCCRVRPHDLATTGGVGRRYRPSRSRC
jgi:hypothetical protein